MKKLQFGTCAALVCFTFVAGLKAGFPQDFDSSGGCPFCSGGLYSDGSFDPLTTTSVAQTAPTPASQPVAANLALTQSNAVFAASATPPGASATLPEIVKRKDGYWEVSFQNLAAFSYVAPLPDKAPTPGQKRDIPQNVQALDGKLVCLSGYMLPVKTEKSGFVTEFLLIRSPMMCCYGVAPAPNEWVVVKMKDRGAVPMMDVPLKFYGTLHVGEVYEEQVFTGIYTMDGDKVSVN